MNDRELEERLLGIKQRLAVGGPWWESLDRVDIKFLFSTIEGLKADNEAAETSIKAWEKHCEGLKLEITEADAWREYWRRDAFRHYPTPEAYDAACKALEKHRKRADDAEAKLETYRTTLEEIETHIPDITNSHVYHEAYIEVKRIARDAL